MDEQFNYNLNMDVDTTMQPGPSSPPQTAGEEVHYVEPLYWCSISYYELNLRVGEVYRQASSIIVVDGFTQPTNLNTNRYKIPVLNAEEG